MPDEKTKSQQKPKKAQSTSKGEKTQKDEIVYLKDFLKHYVKPHRKKARNVESTDLPTVIRDSHILYNLCFTRQGNQAGALAVAHSQINDKDPLRFFVIADKNLIINPVITRHTKSLVKSEEGCTTYPDEKMIEVDRWNKCEVDYQTLELDGKLTEVKHENLDGKMAKIFQHEIDHLDARYIYD